MPGRNIARIIRRAIEWYKNYMNDPSKKLSKRIHWWYIITVVLILGDEYIKEGYFIKPKDFLIPFTHENLLLIATVLYIIAREKLAKQNSNRG